MLVYKGRKRHILVDTQFLLMLSVLHPADFQYRYCESLLMSSLFGSFPFLIPFSPDCPTTLTSAVH